MRVFKIFALMLAVLLFAFSIRAGAEASYVTLYGFGFTISSDNEVVILSYDDRSPSFNPPQTLLGAKVVEIKDYALLNDTAVTELNLSRVSYLRRIGNSAFEGCTEISSVSLPDSVTTLGFGTFQKCTGLVEVSLSENLSEIPSQCFKGCTALTGMSIPDSVGEIGNYAFNKCSGMRWVTIPATTGLISATAFDACPYLTIFGETGSYAETYAAERKILFVDISNKPTEPFLLGDTDGDREITIVDATRIQRILADLDDDSDGLMTLRGDTNGYGLDIIDATVIQRFLAQYEVSDPINSWIDLT